MYTTSFEGMIAGRAISGFSLGDIITAEVYLKEIASPEVWVNEQIENMFIFKVNDSDSEQPKDVQFFRTFSPILSFTKVTFESFNNLQVI